jgi:hypothetical protein
MLDGNVIHKNQQRFMLKKVGAVHRSTVNKGNPLFKYYFATNQVTENGTITADRLEGPMAGKQTSDLATAGANGTLYINIHTGQNPNGEIRGQGGNPSSIENS